MKMRTLIIILLVSLTSICIQRAFGQSDTFLYNIDQTVPDRGQPLTVTFIPGAQFNTNPFNVTLTYTLSNGTTGTISSLDAILNEGSIHNTLITEGEIVGGTSITTPLIYDFIGGKNKTWSLIVTDHNRDNVTMYLESIRMTIPEATSGSFFLLGILFLTVIIFYRRQHT